jgi:Cu/Ag efflux protein CusF
MKLKKELEQHIMELGNSVHYFCDEVESLTEKTLHKIDEKGDNLKVHENHLTDLEMKCMHTMYIRIAGYALIRGVMDMEFAEKVSRVLGVELIQNDLKNGVSVPNDIVDSMLDEINKNKKDENKRVK